MTSYKEMSDSELASHYREYKDSDSFSEIYDRYVKQVYRFIYSLCGNREVTEDIVSQTFFILLEELGSYNGESKLFTYIASIAKYKLYHWYRNESKLTRVYIDEESQLFEELTDETVVPIDTNYYERLEYILNQIPENYKEVLVMRYKNNESIEKIAEVLHKTAGNVRVLLHRALAAASAEATNLS